MRFTLIKPLYGFLLFLLLHSSVVLAGSGSWGGAFINSDTELMIQDIPHNFLNN